MKWVNILAYGKRSTYKKTDNPDFKFMQESELRAKQLTTADRRVQRVVEGRSHSRKGEKQL